MNPEEVKLVVRVSDQTARLYLSGALKKQFTISTAANGTGSEAESGKTPLGLLRVSEKFGDGMPAGTVFKDREPTGQIWQPGDPGTNLILTRILWLEGCEAHNANTKDRYIYLHGTKNEDRLGTPMSQGCINFSNRDIVEVYDLMPVGSLVEIVP